MKVFGHDEPNYIIIDCFFMQPGCMLIVTVRFTKLLTNGFRSSFEILAVRYELSNFIA